MKSVYFKNFIVASAVLLLSFFILGLSLLFVGRSYVINDKRDSLELNAQAVAKYAAAMSEDGTLNGWTLRMTLASVARSTGHHIFICAPDGTVVSCSDMELVCDHLGKKLDAAVMQPALAGGFNQLSTLGDFYEDTHYVVAQPIRPAAGVVIGCVFVSAYTNFIGDVWGTFFLIFVFMSLVVMAIAVTLSFYNSKRQARPIDEMASAARRFAHGDFSVRVQDRGRQDEFGELTEAFNQMADSLEKSESLHREFIANVSHELRTPMTTISGFADGLLDGTIPRENEVKYLTIISSETKRLSRLLRQMLDLTRLQNAEQASGRRSGFDACELLAQVLVAAEERINAKNLSVDLRLPESEVVVLGDRDAITQVMNNLLDNAVKFASSGSELGLMLWKQNGKAMISVRNSGETIPADDLPLIFDRFHKSDHSRSRDREGLGLGLYIVKTILNNHNEDIYVTSKDGVTEFVFTLTLKE